MKANSTSRGGVSEGRDGVEATNATRVVLWTAGETRVSPPKMTLRQARIRKLMSANELGRKAGVAASTVLKIEQGAVPHLATIRKLAQALDMEASEIWWPGDPLGGAIPLSYE